MKTFSRQDRIACLFVVILRRNNQNIQRGKKNYVHLFIEQQSAILFIRDKTRFGDHAVILSTLVINAFLDFVYFFISL